MSLILRLVKGEPLTNSELDSNFIYLNERFSQLSAGDITTGTLDENRIPTNIVRQTRQVATGSGLSGGGDLSGDLTLSVDGTVVRTSGDQDISGIKTFTDPVKLNGAVGIDTQSGLFIIRQKGDTHTDSITITSSHTTASRIWKDASGTTHFSASNDVGGVSITTVGDVNIKRNLNVTSVISGDGSGITNLNASNLSSGTVPRARLSGTYDISITGSAGPADYANESGKWKDPIALTLDGDLSGSVIFDGSASKTWNVAVKNNSHTHDASNITGTLDLARLPTIPESKVMFNQLKWGNGSHKLFNNDGSGNAGLSFGADGNTATESGRPWKIEVQNDNTVGGFIIARSASSATAGNSISMVPVLSLSSSGNTTAHGNLTVNGTISGIASGLTGISWNNISGHTSILTGAGLTGGGSLSQNRTISVDSSVLRTKFFYNESTVSASGNGFNKIVVLNWSKSPTVSVDNASFSEGNEIKIVNQQGGGTVTLNLVGTGTIYFPDGSNDNSISLNIPGTIRLIKYSSTGWMAQVSK